MQEFEINQIYGSETDRVKKYVYNTNTNYEISVISLGLDTHIKATLKKNIVLTEAPSVLFISREAGELEFLSKSLMIANDNLFLECINQAVILKNFIKDYFDELSRGEVDFSKNDYEK